eukprot:4662420-Prymnesium_polylepis.1
MHTASVYEPAGKVLRAADFGGALGLYSDADQLIVYQGTLASPTFLCAFDNSASVIWHSCPGSFGGWHQSMCNTEADARRHSALPSGLTDGVDALS